MKVARRSLAWTWAAALGYFGAALLPGSAPAAAQEAAADTAAATEAEAPAEAPDEALLVEAPFQFRVGPTAGALGWREPSGPGEQRIDDAPLWGLDVASVVGRWAGFRLGGAVGPTSISLGEAEMDAVQYLADVAVEGRLAVDPLAGRGVVPYVTAGVGTVVHDPSPDSLVSRSQSTFSWGAGVEARILDRIGARVEWRRVQAELQSAFDPVARSGSTRFADRWFLGAFWVF